MISVRIAIIVNKSSGRIDFDAMEQFLYSRLTDHMLEFHETRGRGDAALISADLLNDNGVRYVLVAGGDGTLNEVIQPLVGSSKVLIPIPVGTGSDFARALGILEIQDSIDSILSGQIVPVDSVLCKWNSAQRYFVNVLEIGFGGSVMKRVNASKKKGSKVFTRSVMRQLLSLKNYDFTVKYNSKRIEARSPEIIVANGIYFGGGMKASPESSFIDGFLDVHIIGELGRFSLLRRFPKLVDGTYINDKDVINFSTARLTIEGDSPIEMDGEVVGRLPMHMEVVPSSLLFGIPKEIKAKAGD